MSVPLLSRRLQPLFAFFLFNSLGTLMRHRPRLVDASEVTQVPVDQTAAGLGLTDVDQVVLKSVVEIVGDSRLAIQETTVDPADLAAALLVNEQPRAELLGGHLEETCKFLEVHGGVELEVRADGGVEQGVLDLIHEDGGVVVDGVDVGGWVVEVGRSGVDELRAGRAEELLEDGQSLGATLLHAVELLSVLLTDGRVDGVIQTGGVESDTDGDQGVHLVVLLGDGFVVVATLLEVLCPGHIHEDVAEHADGVAVAAHHHVGEAHVVVGGEVGGHHTGEHGFLVHLDIVEDLQGKTEVTEETVHAQQSDDREVTEHLVQGARSVLAGDSHWVLSALGGVQLLADLRALDERVKHVQH